MVKNTINVKIITFLMLLGWAYAIHAQSAYSTRSFSEIRIYENFQSGNYRQVIADLEGEKELSSDDEALLQLSRLRLGGQNAPILEQWLEANERHPLTSTVRFHLGSYYFHTQDTTRSFQKLSAVKAHQLCLSDQASYGFLYGLLQLSGKKYAQAKNLFEYAASNGYEDQTAVDYYIAYCDYYLGRIEESLTVFRKIQDDPEYGLSAKYFIAKILLDRGEIQQVLQLAQKEITEEQTVANSGFYQLIGEAYVKNGEEAKADAYFEKAIQLHPSQPDASLYYQAGISKFKMGNETKAIAYLKKSGIQGGLYAQLSAWQLGRLYLKKGDYENALFAYIEASASEDLKIKEEALYQIVKIFSRLGRFTEAIDYANDYLNLFANHAHTPEIQDLLAQAYLRTSNYDQAIDYLSKVGIKSAAQQEVYQKVTCQKGLLAFNDGQFVVAEKWFGESLKYPVKGKLADVAYYHLGEISMKKGDYQAAFGYYRMIKSPDSMTYYGMAYAQYNLGAYAKALDYFKKIDRRSKMDRDILFDAEVRMADCLYATKNYEEALTLYKRLSDPSSETYLVFQYAKTLKFLGQSEQAIKAFESLFTSPKYASVSMFETAMIYFESAIFDRAITFFSQVIDSGNDTQFLAEAILNRGISYMNLGSYEKAKADFETILREYITSDQALSALLALQDLQQKGQNVSKLDQYIAAYKKAHPNNESLELIDFEAAKRLYFDLKYHEAAKALEVYLKEYPSSNQRTEAKFYLADSYYRLGELAKSRDVFNEIKYVRNNYTGRILARLGDANVALGETDKAIEAYQLLADLKLSPRDTYYAYAGLMSIYFQESEYERAISMANELLKLEWAPMNGKQEAMMVLGKSHLKLGNSTQARKYFAELSEGKDKYAAEAVFQMAKMAYEEAQNEKSLEWLFDLNDRFGSYTYWVDRSYLLIAKNYIAMDELFQAKATLRSIIQHAKDQEVIEEAQILLSSIEQNSSPLDTIKDR